MWEVEVTDEFVSWWELLSDDQQEALVDRVDLLAECGPTLGRPVVDRVHASRHHNMKELRAHRNGTLRVLFMLDPRRQIILLLGGDKAGRWASWYEQAVPRADHLYDAHVRELHEEGLIP